MLFRPGLSSAAFSRAFSKVDYRERFSGIGKLLAGSRAGFSLSLFSFVTPQPIFKIKLIEINVLNFYYRGVLGFWGFGVLG